MRFNFPTALALLLLAAPVFADSPATQPSQRQLLLKRLNALQSRIDQIDQKQTASQVQVMDQIQNDAKAHSQPFSPIVSGYDPDVGFLFETDDGNFSIHPSVLVQARYVVNNRNAIYPRDGGAAGGVNDDTQSGFEVTRFRFTLDGNVINPQLNYYIQIAQDSSMSQLTLLDAYVLYRVGTQSPLAVKVGQFKDPVWHENNLLESRLMAVDRSLASQLVGGGELDRVQGADLIYDDDRLRGQLAVHDGFDGLNTPFYGPSGLGAAVNGAAGVTPTNWGISARGEYLVLGDRTPIFNPYSEYDQFTSRGAKQDTLVVGGGLDFSEAGANNILFHTVDAQYNAVNGFSAYAAFLGVYRDLKTNRGVTPGDYYDDGVVVQAAYLITPQIEPFARYDYTYLDPKANPGILQGNLNEFTIGMNYYLFGQHAKFTADCTWLPEGCPTDVPYLDILEDNAHNEFLFRCQFQLAI